MFAKLESIEKKYLDLEAELAKDDVFSDQDRYKKLAKAHADLKEVVDVHREHKRLTESTADLKIMLDDADPEMRAMAEEELKVIKHRLPELEEHLKVLLLPKDPLDDKNILIEIRAGTGGDEAALFAANLFRMYMRFAEIKGFRTEIMSSSDSGAGFKEIIFAIAGDKVYSRLKYEAGTHRVQRVPETESQGRIHTSAVTVAVLPEADDVEIEIKPDDLRIDVFRSSGPGGQSVNTTDSAVRMTHLPTGIVVQCQDERSLLKNKAKAVKVLKSRLLQLEIDKQIEEQTKNRRAMVGTGDRSGRIRTYNYPQGRITDHRINLTLYKLDEVMLGNLTPVVEPLRQEHQADQLAALMEG